MYRYRQRCHSQRFDLQTNRFCRTSLPARPLFAVSLGMRERMPMFTALLTCSSLARTT